MEQSKIEALIQEMTIEEKLGQMTQLGAYFWGVDPSVDMTGPLNEMKVTAEQVKNVGSTLNYLGAKEVKALQDKAMAEHRLHIPMLFMADIIHGYKTSFPIPLALSCSFNTENYENATSVAAAESAASGVQLTFAPMSDLVRDPRWGRVMESPGEDPYLNCAMTAAAVRGFSGDDIKKKGKVASCVKHFAGYGASQGGRDYNWVDISSNSFRQYYLASYKAALDAGARMVMTSFNVIDGIPSSANKMLFREILRDEWGFDGATISDYAAVEETIINGLSEDGKDAARRCIEAGVDIEMMSTNYINYGKQLVEEGKLSMELIDAAVRNILNLKNDLGLFENPYKDASEADEEALHLCPEHRRLALQAAQQAIVLLKNENDTLPLKKGVKIGVAGPFASSDNTSGGWALINGKDESSLAAGFRMAGVEFVTAMDKSVISMSEGIYDIEDEVESAIEAMKDCDVLIAAVGESPSDTGEAASRAYLRLSPNQEKLVMAMKATGKPVIMVVFSGRPLEIKPMLPYCDAVIQAWFLGTESGNALTSVLFGDYNPSGRLAMSFPQTVGQIPVHYNCYRTGRPYYGQDDHYVSKYLDCPNEPLFPFGYGLSYSKVAYSDMHAEAADGVIRARVTVTNESQIPVRETVQLYVHDLFASVVRPVKELKGFQQVELLAGESRTVEFEVTKDMLKFYNDKMEYVFEPGEFEVMIGCNSRDVECQKVTL